MTGSRLLEIARKNIRARGQLLTVTRPRTTQTGTDTTHTVYFLPQSLNQGSSGNFNQEAGFNLGEENAYDFVCAGDEDVQENDLIGPFFGFKWRVLNPNSNPLDTSAPVLHCYTVREKTA